VDIWFAVAGDLFGSGGWWSDAVIAAAESVVGTVKERVPSEERPFPIQDEPPVESGKVVKSMSLSDSEDAYPSPGEESIRVWPSSL
jgi:hypothetical protein